MPDLLDLSFLPKNWALEFAQEFDASSELPVGLIGVNHKSAELGLRERLATAYDLCFSELRSTGEDEGFVLLNTCNRSELYFSSRSLTATHGKLLKILRNHLQEPFEHTLYSYFGTDCFTHLACVTSGLDSAVAGETEIQGQVKTAYEAALKASDLSKPLHFVFQKSLKIGKTVRTEWLVDRGMPDVEGVAYKVGSMLFDEVQEVPILFVGASEINLKLLRYFKAKGANNITLCNRTLRRAQLIAREEGVQCIAWNQLSHWPDYRWVITGTKCPDHVLTVDQFPEDKTEKQLLIDLSLPRNIEPKLGHRSNVLLFNIDQINQAVDSAHEEVRGYLRKAQETVLRSVHRQVDIYHQRESKRALYSHAL